ncbi:hypothetical protein BJ170DRAFT_691786 [Xylariales sp. AK1849]|nr:hypothetical protein BJ170DRAFT_691786 [Xylariales sp. AK1849]
MTIYSTLVILSTLCAAVYADNGGQFFKPPNRPDKADYDFSNNEVYTIGEIETIQWTTTYSGYTIDLYQQALTQHSAARGPTIFQTVKGAVTQFDWSVQLYSFDLNQSNVFFLWLSPTSSNSTDKPSTHYFNITAADSKVTPTPTPTPPSVPGNNTASDTPSSSSSGGLSTGALAGLGVGAAIGGLVVIGLIGWFLLNQRKKGEKMASAATPATGYDQGPYVIGTPYGTPYATLAKPVHEEAKPYQYPAEMDNDPSSGLLYEHNNPRSRAELPHVQRGPEPVELG